MNRDSNVTLQPDMPQFEDVEINNGISDKKLLRKLDWHILPPISILYLLCYLDRTYSSPFE
jgi:hypothetical protein